MIEFNYTSTSDLTAASITFDWAVHIDFQQKIQDLTGHNMNGHIVMAYPEDQPFGAFVAVTQAGAVMLGAFNKAMGSDYGNFTLQEVKQ